MVSTLEPRIAILLCIGSILLTSLQEFHMQLPLPSLLLFQTLVSDGLHLHAITSLSPLLWTTAIPSDELCRRPDSMAPVRIRLQ